MLQYLCHSRGQKGPEKSGQEPTAMQTYVMQSALRADLCDIKGKTQLLYVLLCHFLNQSSNPAEFFPGSCLEMVIIISIAISSPPEPVSA